MCPVSRGTSRSHLALETGETKLWLLLVGVNQYQDERLPSLRYSALDCQGLAEALAGATQAFPQKQVMIHHDFAACSPHLETVRASLQQIAAAAKPKDTVLFYFSGHGMLEPLSQQAVLCLGDTQKDNLPNTGLGLPELLQLLSNCAAHQQLVWLDACHSGGMTLFGGRRKIPSSEPLLNATPQMVQVLGQRATQSKGFYALLSCDSGQQSWEFPELGHGVFTYFLMRGLRGEAADSQGVINADGLYRYVYHQTLQYIDKTNQQLRLINQHKRGRGETQLYPEYTLQTPKRIVEGVGELILGLKPTSAASVHLRRSLVVEGRGTSKTTLALSKCLHSAGGFELEYWPQPGKEVDVKEAIQRCLQGRHVETLHATSLQATVLLYVRGELSETAAGEPELVVGEDIRLSRSWLRQQLRTSSIPQQIVILDGVASERHQRAGFVVDSPAGTTDLSALPAPTNSLLRDWVEDLQPRGEQGQCIIAAASGAVEPEKFAQALLDTLVAADRQAGLAVAGWITQLQVSLAGSGIPLHVWLSGARGVIEVLPGKTGNRAGEKEGFDLGLCPYMGLNAFKEEDTQYFYGREILTQQLINQLSSSSFLAIVGASGSGKSSVVQAGLIAQLRQGKQLPGSEQWWIRSFRPGHSPLEALSRRLVDPGTEKEKVSQQLQIEGILHQGVEGFVYWLRNRREPMVVLVVDQFEELFTLAAAADRERFLELVLGAVEYAADRFKLIVTLRADFITSCLELPALASFLQQSSVLVPPCLSEDDYRRIIVNPAEQVGLKVEPALVMVLLQELNTRAGDLPLLEFVLEQLWQHRSKGELTLAAYQEQIGGLKGVLERKAQAVYDNLDPDARRCAQWIFLSLIQLGEGTEDTRRRVLKSDLVVAKYPAELVERTLHVLTTAKLVVIDLESAVGQSRGGLRSQGDGASGMGDGEDGSSLARSLTPPYPPLARGGGNAGAGNPDASSYSGLQSHEVQAMWRDPRLLGEVGDLCTSLTRKALYSPEDGSPLAQSSTPPYPPLLRGGDNAGAGIDRGGGNYQSPISEEVALERVKQEVTVEIAHEILIRHWSTLRWWLEENRVRLRQERQIAQAAHLWQQNRQHSDFLLRGVRLAEAEEIYVKYTDELSQEVQLFIAACLEERQKQQLQAKRRLRQAQAAAAVIGMLGLAAFGFGGLAYWQKQEAQLREIEALNSSSEARLSSYQQLEALIAAVKAGKQLHAMTAPSDIQVRTASTLSQAVYQTQERDRLEGHTQQVNSVAFSPDGQLLASASDDKTVRLWSHGISKTLTGHGDRVTNVTFSPDGKTLASACADKTIKIWRTDGTLIQTLTGHGDWVTKVSFSPDGKFLASASRDKTVKLWRTDGTLLKTLNGHTGWVWDVSFSPDGKIASASEDKTIKVWRTDGTLINTFTGHGERVTRVTFSPDGHTLASASGDKTVKLWNTAGILQTLDGHTDGVNSLSFSPDGQMLASVGADGTVRLWVKNQTLPTGFTYVETLKGHGAEVLGVSFSPDGKMATGSADKTVRLWDLGNIQQPKEGGISSVTFSPDGRTFATAGWDKTVKLWYINDGISISSFKTLPKHASTVAALRFSPDGKTLASASWDKTINLWRVADGRLIQTLTGHVDGVTSISYSPDGKLIASGSADKTIKLWRVANGTLVQTLTGHVDKVTSVSFSPDGKLLASGSADKTVKLWNLDATSTALSPQTFREHGNEIASVTFSPDGKTLASASWDNTIKLWRVADGMLKTLSGHTNGVESVSFSPDGQVLVSGSADETIKLWNTADGTLLKTLSGYRSPVHSVSFSPDGKALISAGEDSGVILWNLDLDNLLKRGCDRLHDYLNNNPNVKPSDRHLCDNF